RTVTSVQTCALRFWVSLPSVPFYSGVKRMAATPHPRPPPGRRAVPPSTGPRRGMGCRPIGRDTPSRGSARSIAVLPFANLSGDRNDEYFSDGMSEELITALHAVPGLRVAARTSAFAFRDRNVNAGEIGKELNVATLLEGSVRRAGSRVRVNAQLIDAADGYQLWAEEYERDIKDVFAVQDDISRSIVHALQVTLEGATNTPLVRRSTASPEAHDLYLKGRYFFGLRTE